MLSCNLLFPSLMVGVFVRVNSLSLSSISVDLQLLLLELKSLYFGKHLIFSHHYFKPHTLAEKDGSALGILGTLNLKSSQSLVLPVLMQEPLSNGHLQKTYLKNNQSI